MCEQVYNRYYDTAGNYHWTGVRTGEHIERGVIMKTLEDLILFHNSDQRAQIYNRVANIVFNEFGYHVNNSEIALCCSYVVNKMIEDGRLKVNDNQRINESGYITTNE